MNRISACLLTLVFLTSGPAMGRNNDFCRSSFAAEDTTYLYQKLGAGGEHLKFGITANPATRYTAAELNGGSLNIIAQGQRADMLSLERNLHSTLPIGPEEGQLFYIQQQTARGLIPPPYP